MKNCSLSPAFSSEERIIKSREEAMEDFANHRYDYLREHRYIINSPVKKIVIVNSGGDAPGMNASVRAVARTAILNGIEVVGVYYGFKGLYKGKFKKMTIRNVCDIIHRGGTKLYTARFPEFEDEKVVKRTAEVLRKNNVDAVIVVGGDGSFKGARALIKHGGIPCIAIPATIDNDIGCTEYTIGYDTCLNTIVQMVDRIRDTVESHDRCVVVETMGANSGYLTLDAGIAVGATAIVIPEIPYDIQKDVIDKIIHTKSTGKNHFIVLVAEAIRKKTGITVDDIAKEIEAKTKVETRATVLGYVQRGGSPTAIDRVIASRMGNEAVNLLIKGIYNRVVVMQDNRIMDFDLERALEVEKGIDEDLYRCAMDISL